MTSDCGWCGAPNTHYMTHVCPDCTCWHQLVSIPGEPQMGSYIESEWNPECTVHAAWQERGSDAERQAPVHDVPD